MSKLISSTKDVSYLNYLDNIKTLGYDEALEKMGGAHNGAWFVSYALFKSNENDAIEIFNRIDKKDVQYKDNLAIRNAIMHDLKEAVKQLGPYCNYELTSTKNPIYFACYTGKKWAVEELIKHNTNLNFHNRLFEVACKMGHDDIIMLLLDGVNETSDAYQNGLESVISDMNLTLLKDIYKKTKVRNDELWRGVFIKTLKHLDLEMVQLMSHLLKDDNIIISEAIRFANIKIKSTQSSYPSNLDKTKSEIFSIFEILIKHAMPDVFNKIMKEDTQKHDGWWDGINEGEELFKKAWERIEMRNNLKEYGSDKIKKKRMI